MTRLAGCLAVALAAWSPAAVLAGSGGPDSFGYCWQEGEGIEDVVAEPLLEGSGEVELELPFAFELYGQPWERVVIRSDGALGPARLDAEAPPCVDGADGPVVAAWWGEVHAHEVAAEVVGDQPDRRLVVAWTGPDWEVRAALHEGGDRVSVEHLALPSARGVAGIGTPGEGVLAWRCGDSDELEAGAAEFSTDCEQLEPEGGCQGQWKGTAMRFSGLLLLPLLGRRRPTVRSAS